MTHIIKHPYIQDHKRLARAYQRMANSLSSKGTSDDIVVSLNTLRTMADEHRRKAKIAGRKGAKFIFYK